MPVYSTCRDSGTDWTAIADSALFSVSCILASNRDDLVMQSRDKRQNVQAPALLTREGCHNGRVLVGVGLPIACKTLNSRQDMLKWTFN